MIDDRSHEFPTPSGFTSVDEYLSSLVELYKSPLIRQLAGNLHIVDFFLPREHGGSEEIDLNSSKAESRESEKNLFEDTVPSQWQNFFDSNAIDDIIDGLVYGGLGLMEKCPEDLEKLVAAVRSHSLDRSYLGPSTNSLPNNLMGGMNSKKRYECEQYSALLISQAQEFGADSIVDLGSGKGHLARTLAARWANPIITVESNDLYISSAQFLDAKWTAKRKKVDSSPLHHKRGSITHINSRIENTKQFSDIFTRKFFDDNKLKFGKSLVGGLHACGNLTNLAICSIVDCPQVTAVSVVGCCYNLLTNRQDGNATIPGFPLSHHVAAQVESLSMTSRMLASQAPSVWTRKARQSSFQRNFFRALLQKIIYDYKIATDSRQPLVVGKLPSRAYDDFGQYCFEAFKKLSICLPISDGGPASDLVSQKEIVLEVAKIYLEKYGRSYNHLCLLWTLMAVCTSTLTEAIITLDRYFYLVENNIPNVKVSIIFDYKISPRNILVSAAK